MIPKPGARVTIVAGEPIEVPAKLDADGTVALRLKLETALHAAHAEADAASGYCDSEPLRLAPAPTLAAHAGGSP